MKVGVYLEDLSPQAGGGFTFQDDILKALIEVVEETRHTFVIFCRRPEAFRSAFKSSPIEAIGFQGHPAQRLISRASRALSSLSGNRRPPPITGIERAARASGTEFMWFVGDQALPVDLPYLATVWDLQHRLQPWFPEVSEKGIWDHRELIYSTYLRRAAVVIAGTNAGREEIERFYQVPTDRIKILPHPTPRFALDVGHGGETEVLDKYGLPAGYLFYPAQFWSHKNHANLLLALSVLREKYQLIMPVVLAGSDKGNQTYIKRLVEELGLSAHVHFLGFVPQEDLASLYRRALALTYLSFFGPENLPPLEAFALGCPVIAAEVSGAREQLGEAALLVDPKNVEQIAASIKSLHDDAALRETLVQNGLARATGWTGRDFVKGVFAILDEFEPMRRCWNI